MSDTKELKKICGLLREKYGTRGDRAAESLQQWLSGAMPFAYPEIVARHLDEQRLGLLFDCFWQVAWSGLRHCCSNSQSSRSWDLGC